MFRTPRNQHRRRNAGQHSLVFTLTEKAKEEDENRAIPQAGVDSRQWVCRRGGRVCRQGEGVKAACSSGANLGEDRTRSVGPCGSQTTGIALAAAPVWSVCFVAPLALSASRVPWCHKNRPCTPPLVFRGLLTRQSAPANQRRALDGLVYVYLSAAFPFSGASSPHHNTDYLRTYEGT